MRQGQAEILIIVGVIVVIVAVIVFSFSSSIFPPRPIPTAVQQDQKLVKLFVESMIIDKVYENILDLETHGGYFGNEIDSPLTETTTFLNLEVPYWTRCENTLIVSKTSAQNKLNDKLRKDLISNLTGIDVINGKKVDFSLETTNVNTNILENKIDITVDLITKVSDFEIRESYTVSMPTNFGRILNFASDFSLEQVTNRNFERFTRFDLEFFSDLPRAGFLNTCGERIVYTPQEISDRMERIANDIVINTDFWEDTVISDSMVLQYGIKDLQGNVYADLETEENILLSLSDDFQVQTLDAIVILNINPLFSSTKFPLPYVCSGFYEQNYSFSYPVIVRVYDSIMNNYFHFANFVYIDNNQPGSCDAIITQTICDNLQCNVEIAVLDGDGVPIQGTGVYVGSCLIDETDDIGIANGPAPCGSNNIIVFNTSDLEIYNKIVSITGSYSDTITLNRIPVDEFHFVQTAGCSPEQEIDNEFVLLTLEPENGGNSYVLSNNDVVDINPCLESIGVKDACDKCVQDQTDIQSCDICRAESNNCLVNTITTKTEIDYMPAGDYLASALIFNPKKINAAPSKHAFISVPIITREILFTIPQDDSHINVMLPDTDFIYNRATQIYIQTVIDREGECDGFDAGPLGCAGNRVTREQAEAEALDQANRYVQILTPIFLEVCNE